jgi:Holliday junction resolvasome RuvABC ATP-dependent DNA helicase subunit
MGKTRLSEALAAEYRTTCHRVLGRAKPEELCRKLVAAEHGDFLFLDEAHSLPRDTQEALFEVMDRGRIKDYLGDQNRTARRDEEGRLVVPPVCVILASDQPGELLEALKRRMEHHIALTDYAVQELVEIGAAEASRLGLTVSPQAMRSLARAAQGQPRRINQYLKGLQRHFADAAGRMLRRQDVRAYLHSAGLDHLGLDAHQQGYIEELRSRGRASLGSLARQLGVDVPFVLSHIEPGLLRLRLVDIGSQGRRLTREGRDWVRAARKRRAKRDRRANGDH